jgi:hypothetical protein
MSPAGFRWFVCAVVAVLVVVMLVVLRGNGAWPIKAPELSRGEQHSAVHPVKLGPDPVRATAARTA